MGKPHSNDSSQGIRDQFFCAGDAASVLGSRTGLVDEQVIEAHAAALQPVFGNGLALLAVGGFGRRELFPCSDVDLLILVEETPDHGERKEALSVFLRQLWDGGLRLSQSVRTIAECSELHERNIELNISLLDRRYLAGAKALHDHLEARLPRFLYNQRRDLARHLAKLTRSRHAKFHQTIYHLEPNVKETPGGLRDLHLIHWVRTLLGEAVSDPQPALDAARQFLSRVRCFLHYQSGRDNNALTFDSQEQITEQPFVETKDPARWMREYFRHARAIHLEALRWLEKAEDPAGTILSHFRDWRTRLSNAEFTVSRERVYLKAPQQLEGDPDIVIRLFTFIARHGIRLALDTDRRLAGHLPRIRTHYPAAGDLWPALKELLSLPHAGMALKAMDETGVLEAIFPEWARIDCLVVRDFYHRYTVDEHSLMAIQNLLDLAAVREGSRWRFAGVFEEISQGESQAVLLFALLFHDVGKGVGEGAHVPGSLRIVDGVTERIGMPQEQRELVGFLIDRHLDLSSVMNSRDLDDPDTAQYIAHRIGTVERLKLLALLTYADISAVNPGAMTPWRLEQLWRIYLITHNELTRELDNERIAPGAVAVKPDLTEFLEGFPIRYLRTHSPAEIEAHADLERRSRSTGVAIELSRENGVYRLDLVSRDRPGLLASIAGALAGFGMNILKAEAFGNRKGIILDTFTFSDPHRTLELNPVELDRLRVTLQRVTLGRLDVKELLQNRPKPVPLSRKARVQPRVSFDGNASRSATLIEIVAEDRPGLLYDLASTLFSHGCNIEVVLIDTEANKALDVFYVTYGGEKVPPPLEGALRENMLRVCAL